MGNRVECGAGNLQKMREENTKHTLDGKAPGDLPRGGLHRTCILHNTLKNEALCSTVTQASGRGCQVGLAQLEHALHTEAAAHAQRRLGFG